MHIIHNTIGVPKITEKSLGENFSKFSIGPLPSGYGVTIGNSLRRVMLSSIPGVRVTGIKVKGVSHEYTTLPWVKDTILDIMLNLKKVVFTMDTDETIWVSLVKKKIGVVTAVDIKMPSGVSLINSDTYITELDTNNFELAIDIRLQKWVGYTSVEDLKKNEDDVNVLLIDANFSPVQKVSYDIHPTRHGDMINLDELDIEIKTNGTFEPKEVLQFSSDMLKSYFGIFNEEGLQVEGKFISNIKDLLDQEKSELKEEIEKEEHTPIEIMWLSPRTLNALVNGNILSIEQLAKCTEAKLSSIKGFGKRAMTEVRWALNERDLKLLWDE